MNFKRGLFRIWMTICLIWVCLTGFTSYSMGWLDLTGVELIGEAPPCFEKLNGYLRFDCDLKDRDWKQSIFQIQDGDEGRATIDSTGIRFNVYRKIFNFTGWLKATALMFTPPILIFLLALNVSWILYGFKTDKI